MTWELGLRYPDRVAGRIGICGSMRYPVHF